MLYHYATSTAIATTTLKFIQFGSATIKADNPQWNMSELVGSEETRQALTKHPRYVTPIC